MNACATLCRSPNIVLVVLDGASRVPGGLRAASYGPDVERLAARGLRYTSYHPEAPARFAKASACLAELLRSRGYAIVTAGDRQSYADGNPSGTAGTARDAEASPGSFIDGIRVLESCASGAPACPLFFRFFTAAPAERAAFLIGRILTSLERGGALEDTLFVLIPMRPAASSCSDERPGVRTDTMIVHWPAGIAGSGAFRRQHVHAIDVVPTVLEILGLDRSFFEGTSLVQTFSNPDAPLVEGPPPCPLGPRTYICHPGRVSMSMKALPKRRSHVIIAHAVIPEHGAEGVILAQGGRFFGSSLFVKDNRLWYARTCADAPDVTMRSNVTVPAGPCVFAFEFRKRPPSAVRATLSASGRLYVNGRMCAEAIFPAGSTLVQTIEGDALCCGYDCGLLGLPEYRPRFRFTGVIKQVVVDVSGDPYQPGGFGEPGRRLQ
jgi:hypothetical protein